MLAVAFGLLLSAAAPAASFSVQRGSSAADVRSSSPRAIVVSSPFDDDADSLIDGQLHFYTVVDDLGAAVPLSIHKNRAENSVRIAFDDGQSFGSAADATLSSASAMPASAVADGVSTVTLRVVPRDVTGTPLGTGLSIELDTAALWPANVIGSVVDHGDGSYSVRIASSIPTTGNAVIGVEGVWLNSEPAFEFTDPGLGTQRDQAIDRLEDLGGSGGQFEQLMEQFSGNAAVHDKLGDGLGDFVKALSDLDKLMDVKAVEKRLVDALLDLGQARDLLVGQEREDVELLMDRIAESVRMIATHHIAAAEAACGLCGTAGSGAICGARMKLDSGVSLLGLATPQHAEAVLQFAAAIEQADLSCDGSDWRPAPQTDSPA